MAGRTPLFAGFEPLKTILFRGYHRTVPIYEFQCERCESRFERLLDAGTEIGDGTLCPNCGADRVRRVYSPQAPTPQLVKTPGENRKQEARNAKLHEAAKADFKERRRRLKAAGAKPGPES